MTDERDLRNFEPAAPLPEGARGRSRVEAGLPPAPPARPADDRKAVLPQWAIAELDRLRHERDMALDGQAGLAGKLQFWRYECERVEGEWQKALGELDRARDSACLYEQIIERIGGTHIFGRPFYPGVWVSNDMRDQGAYVVEGPR